MWCPIAVLLLPLLAQAAIVLDRIAVIAGTHVIKTSDIDRDIRVTDFLNRVPLAFSEKAKRDSAERLITQEMIRDEIVSGGYRRPPASEATQMENQLVHDRFGGSEQRMEAELKHYGLTEPELREQLLWQLTVLQFIDERFRPGVVVTDDDVRTYYDQHLSELKRAYPKDSSLKTLEPKIRQILEGEGINKAFNEWLDDSRKTYHVEFKQRAFQ